MPTIRSSPGWPITSFPAPSLSCAEETRSRLAVSLLADRGGGPGARSGARSDPLVARSLRPQSFGCEPLVARSLRASVLPHTLLALDLRADTRERFLRPRVTPFEPAPAVRGHAQEGRVGLGEHLAVGRPRKRAARLEQPAAVPHDLAHDSQLLTHLRRMPEGDVDAGGHSPDPLVADGPA